jgi:methylenetetrahydrofolate reductase (NADPH)
VLANVYVLPHGAARLMNANGVPGCVVTDKLLAETAAEAKADDKGKSARLQRAAKQYAIAKGMGCAGAHIGGHGISYENVEYIVDEGERLAANWQDLVREFDYPQDNGFYFFEKDESTGLNTDTPAPRTARGRAPMVYRMSRMAHSVLFNEKSVLFRMLRPVAARIDARPRSRKTFGFFEHLAKVVMFDCMNCGDCGLFDVAYVCPMSQCPKQQRNGPCGGSYEGWCEVYPGERQCIWVQAYDRLKVFKEQEKIEDHIAPPCNWALWQTPSWLNFYLGKDHTAKRLGIEPYRKLSRAEKSEARKRARSEAAEQGQGKAAG